MSRIVDTMTLGQRAGEQQETNLRMRSARAALGLTQADLAKQVGASRQTISMIEAGAHNPTQARHPRAVA